VTMTAPTTNGSTSGALQEASQALLDTATPIAVVRSYDHLRHAIADWCEQIHMSRAELDADAGLADGHAAKLLARRARRRLGPVSLGRVLAAAGLVLIVARDPDTPQRNASTVASKPRALHWRSRRGSAWGKRMAALRALKLPAPRRSEIARNAALARHRRRLAPAAE
jgi:hypothetical protein